MKASERHDPAHFRAHPEQVLIRGIFRHGKDAGAIGPNDQFGRDLDVEGIGRAGHAQSAKNEKGRRAPL